MLTPSGERLLPRARVVVDAVEAFRTEADLDRRPLVGRLRIGVIPTVAPYLLPSALRGLRRHAPELEPVITEDQTDRLVASLRDGRLDVAVLALPTRESGLAEIPLYDEDFVLVVGERHPWAGTSGLTTEVLRDAEPLLLLSEGHCLRDQALDVCRAVGADPVDTATHAASLATVVQLVAGGLGSTLLPDTAVAVETRRGGLATARFAEPAPGRRVGLVHRSSSARGGEYDVLAAILRRSVRADRLRARVVDTGRADPGTAGGAGEPAGAARS